MRHRFSVWAGLAISFGAMSWTVSVAPVSAYEYQANAEPSELTAKPRAVAPAREIVAYEGPHKPGTIIVSTAQRRLYYILPGNRAVKYGIGVGRPGFEWSGTRTIAMKREWPSWTPPSQMRRRRPDLPRYMRGGPSNPLGARAMYLSGTLYRIHGSNEPETIGHAVSSGCIRMTNEDVVDLYNRVKIGARVVVMR
jgi:lipoprotein-anchoring transpeptidase ErfK/SrfK